MVRKYLRLIIASMFLVGAVLLFINSSVYWGLLVVLVAGLVVLTHFKNVNNLKAFYYIRKNNIDAAGKILDKVKHPERMIKSQEAYFYFLSGLIESQRYNASKSEKFFKKAIDTGLRMKNDQAVAKLNLAGMCLTRRNKNMAKHYLQEAKKLDKHKMLTAQIQEIEGMLRRI